MRLSRPGPTAGRDERDASRHAPPERNAAGLQRRFVDVLSWVIVLAWAVSFIVNMIDSRYQPPAVVHPLMLAVAAAAYGRNLIKGGDG